MSRHLERLSSLPRAPRLAGRSTTLALAVRLLYSCIYVVPKEQYSWIWECTLFLLQQRGNRFRCLWVVCLSPVSVAGLWSWGWRASSFFAATATALTPPFAFWARSGRSRALGQAGLPLLRQGAWRGPARVWFCLSEDMDHQLLPSSLSPVWAQLIFSASSAEFC